MKAGYTVVAFCFLLSTVSQLRPQQEPQESQQAQERDRKPGEIRSIRVNLCQMADQMDNGALARPLAQKLEIETKDLQTKHMPGHLDVVLSVKHRDEAVFYCSRGSKNYPFRIDSFVKAKMPAHPQEQLDPGTPDAPFPPPILNLLALKSSSQRHTGIPLAAAVHQRYKFTFTVFKNAADPTGKRFDPHLIVTP